MKYCYGYIGVACVTGQCPVIQEIEEGVTILTKCDECWYYKGCKDCAAPYYKYCPEGKNI